jgi:hypothetical protein
MSAFAASVGAGGVRAASALRGCAALAAAGCAFFSGDGSTRALARQIVRLLRAAGRSVRVCRARVRARARRRRPLAAPPLPHRSCAPC